MTRHPLFPVALISLIEQAGLVTGLTGYSFEHMAACLDLGLALFRSPGLLQAEGSSVSTKRAVKLDAVEQREKLDGGFPTASLIETALRDQVNPEGLGISTWKCIISQVPTG